MHLLVAGVTLDGEEVDYSVEADGAVITLAEAPESGGLRVRYQR